MSIGRITPSWATFRNENTLALAGINFDFSLFKLEAPKEFDGLGAALSFRRRDEAENGFQHRTARRLGALFEQILPDAPNLLQAYGKRASEVSASPEVNPKGSSKDGVFEQQVGADGTTIWAAATSGPGAIAAHLLACMLARIWPSEHSTSLWVEIVQERQREIESYGASQNLSTRCAAQQHISRHELAKWDASARAWLRSADQAKHRHQTQLMLIFKNVNLSVNSSLKTYDSVLQAWKIAMSSVDRLLKGESLLVQNGAVLLGVSAWHLYPNLVVLKEKSDPILFKDDLMPETSFLTIGIDDPRMGLDGGVHWSLPLGHLRYYGEPVLSSASVNQATGRILMSEFVYVFLGAISKDWGFSGPEATAILTWFSELWSFFSRGLTRLDKDILVFEESLRKQEIAAKSALKEQNRAMENHEDRLRNQPTGSRGSPPSVDDYSAKKSTPELDAGDNGIFDDSFGKTPAELVNEYGQYSTALESRHSLRRRLKALLNGDMNWLQILAHGAQKILQSDGFEREHRMSLFRLGQRAEILVTRYQQPAPLYGLLDFKYFLHLLRGEEMQISVLREACSKLDIPATRLLIRYQPVLTVNQRGEPSGQSFLDGPFKRPGWTEKGVVEYEFATAKPRTSSIKRRHDGAVVAGSGHTRWLNVISSLDPLADSLEVSGNAFYLSKAQMRRNKIVNTNETVSLEPQMVRVIGRDMLHWCPPSAHFNDNDDESQSDDREATLSAFDFIGGDSQRAAVYLMRGRSVSTLPSAEVLGFDTISIDAATKMLTDDLFGVKAALDYFDTCPKLFPKSSWYFRSMRAFCSAMEIYESFPSASISLKVASFPLHDAPWLPKNTSDSSVQPNSNSSQNESLRSYPLNRAQSFACIVNFELGCQDVSPNGLDVVVAISSGDSIFVASQVLCDPAVTILPNKIKRIVGNIGLPGIAMLVPPAAPIIRKPDLDRFYHVKHEIFDGKMIDQFGKTQLQLSFTEYERAVDVGIRGGRDNVLFFLEALVTVTDSGEKVADLDVLAALEHRDLLHRCMCHCKRSKVGTMGGDREQQCPRLISVDNWEEFIQRPDEAAILRAHDNWQARLAATCISVARGHPTFVLTKGTCWKCAKRLCKEKMGKVPPDSMFVS